MSNPPLTVRAWNHLFELIRWRRGTFRCQAAEYSDGHTFVSWDLRSRHGALLKNRVDLVAGGADPAHGSPVPIFTWPWLLAMSLPGLRPLKGPISVRACHRQWRFGYTLATACHQYLKPDLNGLTTAAKLSEERLEFSTKRRLHLHRLVPIGNGFACVAFVHVNIAAIVVRQR